MVSFSELPANNSSEYRCLANLNIYDSPNCTRLATQAALGRHLRVLEKEDEASVKVQLVEDDYPGWLTVDDLQHLEFAQSSYQAIALSKEEIQSRVPAIVAFTHRAMQIPNDYLWGGTVGPNYDCSGLVQAAFVSEGVWLPRDAYQQEAFTVPIALEEVQPGDLVFFGPAHKATHVGLCLGEGRYIHSSGKDQGRNGIGIDILSEVGDVVSQTYYRQLRGFGRVVASYQPSAGF